LKAVLKIGGSLIKFPDNLSSLLKEIEKLANQHRLLLVPGGGVFADLVSKTQQDLALSDDIAHWMAIMAQNQFGMLLADRLTSKNVITKIEEFVNSNSPGLFVLMPFSSMKEMDELPHTWDVTGDSISLWIGEKALANFVLLVKCVDGIANPSEESQILTKLEAKKLNRIDIRNVLDRHLPKIAPRFSGRIFVVNGLHPKRIGQILSNYDTICTEIIST
jgi:aspartokinase-like uncharacterized kinase